VPTQRISVHDAKEVIDMADDPVKAVRAKRDSSMVVGASLVRQDKYSVFLSAGSTGALLASALLFTGRIEGIYRPALTTMLPGKRPFLFLDNGANADCKAEYLLQFAKMGSVYMEAVMGVKNPRVGLLNIGSEEHKGSMFIKEAHELLAAEKGINFYGNAEPKDLLDGCCDVVVTDGFTGNIMLKTLEATISYLLSMIKGALKSSTKTKIGGLMIKKDLKKTLKSMDPSAYGGALLLGINGGIFKTHGNSDAATVRNAVKLAIMFQKENVLDRLTKVL
jgi:glycerol-3-phosphate acyltransferase PlsX